MKVFDLLKVFARIAYLLALYKPGGLPKKAEIREIKLAISTKFTNNPWPFGELFCHQRAPGTKKPESFKLFGPRQT